MTASDAAPAAAAPRAGARGWAALAVLSLAVLLVAVDGTVLGLAVPAISADLRPTAAQLLWIVDIYSFVLAGLLVTMGALGDRIGRRRLLLLGATGFGIASAVAAHAASAEALIAARALLGLAGATLMPSTLALLRALFRDPRQRTIAIGVWSGMAAGGAALGPIVGGWLLERAEWGSVFLINVPVMALLLVLAPLLVPESRGARTGPFDLLGAGLSLLAVLPVVYGLKTLVTDGPTPVVPVAVGAGVLAAVAFVRRQRRLTAPLVDLRLFDDLRFTGAVTINLLTILTLVGSLFFGAQHLQLVLGLGPLEAGLALVPAMLAALVGSPLAAPLGRALTPRWALTGGLVVAAGGIALLTGLQPTGGRTLFTVALALIGLGVGVALAVTNDAAMTAAPAERAGAAASVAETAYELGTALGAAVLGSVLTAAYRAELRLAPTLPTDLADRARDTLAGALEVSASLPPDGARDLADAARYAFTEAVQLTSLVGALIALAAAVLAVVLLRPPGGGRPQNRSGA